MAIGRPVFHVEHQRGDWAPAGAESFQDGDQPLPTIPVGVTTRTAPRGRSPARGIRQTHRRSPAPCDPRAHIATRASSGSPSERRASTSTPDTARICALRDRGVSRPARPVSRRGQGTGASKPSAPWLVPPRDPEDHQGALPIQRPVPVSGVGPRRRPVGAPCRRSGPRSRPRPIVRCGPKPDSRPSKPRRAVPDALMGGRRGRQPRTHAHRDASSDRRRGPLTRSAPHVRTRVGASSPAPRSGWPPTSVGCWPTHPPCPADRLADEWPPRCGPRSGSCSSGDGRSTTPN